MAYSREGGKAKTIAMLACLCSIVAATRIVMAAGPPNVKPAAFLSIFSGIIGGPMFGLTVGVVGMAVSDIYLGIGPWTLITSGCMGLVGFLGGFVDYEMSRIGLTIIGFLYTLIYDVLSSLLFAVIYGYSWWLSIVGLYLPFLMGSVYPFGLIHEATTAVLLGLAGPPLIRRAVQIVS